MHVKPQQSVTGGGGGGEGGLDFCGRKATTVSYRWGVDFCAR